MSAYREAALRVAELVEEKQQAYGDSFGKAGKLLRIFLEKYYNADTNTYNIPDSLIDHIPYMVRVWDKQSRIFSNPDGDLLDENPYLDMMGYDLLAVVAGEKRVKAARRCCRCGKPAPADARYCSSECAWDAVRTDKAEELRRLTNDESNGSHAAC